MGLLIYRVRGRSYPIQYPRARAGPAWLGKYVLRKIPPDLRLLAEWKRAKVSYYITEEQRIYQLSRKNTERWEAIPDSYWGGRYFEKPSRRQPDPGPDITWIYTIDLDEDKFEVSCQDDMYDKKSFTSRSFRLDSIPRFLFDRPFDPIQRLRGWNGSIWYGRDLLLHPLMTTDIHQEYEFHTASPPLADPNLKALYHAAVHEPLVNRSAPLGKLSSWKAMQLLLLKHLVARFISSFKDFSKPQKDLRLNHTYRQISYTIMCIVRGQNNFTLRAGSRKWGRKDLLEPTHFATPTWDPPDCDNYFLDGCLVILEPQITNPDHLQAAIGMAIGMAQESNTTAIIFSIAHVVIVNISRSNDVVVEAHTDLLILLPETINSQVYSRELSIDTVTTIGVLALLHLPPSIRYPSTLSSSQIVPAEVAENIVRFCDPSTQVVLRHSSIIFQQLTKALPRLDEWTLVKAYGGERFPAVSSKTGGKANVSVDSWTGVVFHNECVRMGLETGDEIEIHPLRVRRIYGEVNVGSNSE